MHAKIDAFTTRTNLFHVITIKAFHELFKLNVSTMKIKTFDVMSLHAVEMLIFHQSFMFKKTENANAFSINDSIFKQLKFFDDVKNVVTC